MASKAFANVAANTKLNKNLDGVIVGSTSLGEGTHDVTVQAVDTSEMDNNKLAVTYASVDGKVFTDRIFVLSQDQTEFSFSLRQLWSGILADKDAIGKLIEMAASDNKALEMFTGMKCRITLAPGKGIQARSTGTGKYAGYDVTSGEKATEEYDEIKEVYNEVKARSLKRSYLQIKKSEVVDNKEANLAAFNFAVAAKEKAQNGGAVSAFSAGKAV